MPHPCHEDLHQPAGFQPDNIHHPDHPGIDVPTDTDEEEELFKVATGQPLPHRAPTPKFPSPVRHLPAPAEVHIPLPSTLNATAPAVDPPPKA